MLSQNDFLVNKEDKIDTVQLLNEKGIVKVKLKSEKYRVVKVKSKTTAKGFKEIEPGDIIQFSTVIEKRRSGYSIDVQVENLSKPGNSASKTIIEIPKFIKNLVLEEVY